MLWICVYCTCAYSVGAPRCPQCGSTNHVEEGNSMPKITRHGGASYEPVVAAAGEGEPERPEPQQQETQQEEREGEDTSSVDYEQWSYNALQAEAKRLDLSARGTRDELVHRLTQHAEHDAEF